MLGLEQQGNNRAARFIQMKKAKYMRVRILSR